jgi:hypothetical protein
MLSQYSECSVMFRLFSECSVMFRLCSQYLAQQAICSEFLDFAVYFEMRCFQAGSMNECSQSLPIAVWSNTHNNILRNFVMLLNVSDLIDVILYWNANNCQIKKYASILQTLILDVVVFQR